MTDSVSKILSERFGMIEAGRNARVVDVSADCDLCRWFRTNEPTLDPSAVSLGDIKRAQDALAVVHRREQLLEDLLALGYQRPHALEGTP